MTRKSKGTWRKPRIELHTADELVTFGKLRKATVEERCEALQQLGLPVSMNDNGTLDLREARATLWKIQWPSGEMKFNDLSRITKLWSYEI